VGTQLPLPQTGTAPPPIFGPSLLRPNGCMDQDVTCYGARPRPRRLCVRWGPRGPSPKRGAEPPPNFRPVYCGQTVGWMKLVLGKDVGRSPGDFVLDGDLVPFTQKGAEPPSPIFGPFLLCPNGWMHQDATRYGGMPHPRRVCVRWGPSPPSQKGVGAPSSILRVEVRISILDRKCGALPVVANFAALEQQIILLKTRSESV